MVIIMEVRAMLLVILLDRGRAFGCALLWGRITPQDYETSAIGLILL